MYTRSGTERNHTTTYGAATTLPAACATTLIKLVDGTATEPACQRRGIKMVDHEAAGRRDPALRRSLDQPV
jgi:hypothetical protein